MGDERERTTGADSATILADFRRRFAAEFRGIVIDRIRVLLPGAKPGTSRVVVCEDADEAAACLHGTPPSGARRMTAEAASAHDEFDYHDPVYLAARKAAFARSDGKCQLCGQQPAVEAHHWAVDYPPAHKTTADDLTALCSECHFIATTIRRFTRAGGSRHQLCAVLSKVIAGCDLNSPFPASPPSSCTTARPDSTPEALSAARSQRSRRSAAATAPPSTTSGSESSSATGPSISTLTTDPRYRRQRFGR